MDGIRPDIRQLFAAKEAWRRVLAALPFPAKVAAGGEAPGNDGASLASAGQISSDVADRKDSTVAAGTPPSLNFTLSLPLLSPSRVYPSLMA